jgi:hypothetical protein
LAESSTREHEANRYFGAILGTPCNNISNLLDKCDKIILVNILQLGKSQTWQLFSLPKEG